MLAWVILHLAFPFLFRRGFFCLVFFGAYGCVLVMHSALELAGYFQTAFLLIFYGIWVLDRFVLSLLVYTNQ